MTKSERKEMRREVGKQALASLSREFRLCATNNQIKHAVRTLTDRVFAEARRNP